MNDYEKRVKQVIAKFDLAGAVLVGDTYYGIKPLMFHWSLIVGDVNDEFSYDDRWCMADARTALTALYEWNARDFKGEPLYWHRHPKTGRRRPLGNAAAQYVEH